MSELQTWLKQFTDCRERGFCILDGLVYCPHPKGGCTIVILEDEELRQKLLGLHHNLLGALVCLRQLNH